MFSQTEINGLIANAVSSKTVWVSPTGDRMDVKKSKITPVAVHCHKITTDRVGILNLNHVAKAVQNGGTFVRTVKGNPIAVVVVK